VRLARDLRIVKLCFLAATLAVCCIVTVSSSARGRLSTLFPWFFDLREAAPRTLDFKSVLMRGPGAFFRLRDAVTLDPQVNRDFVFSFWFSLKDLPESTERDILVAKFEGESRNRAGYAIAVRKDGSQLQPSVYWRGKKQKGGWYEFPPMLFSRESWYLLILSFRQQQFLGLHYKLTEPENLESKLTSLGGYDIAEVGSIENSSMLLVGSPARSGLRMLLGPVAIVSGASAEANFQELLGALEQGALEPLQQVSHFSTVLWLEGSARDASGNQHKVKAIRVKEAIKASNAEGKTYAQREARVTEPKG
jgi:hypothetical protein